MGAAVAAGVRRRFAPHQLRHAHAIEMSREGSHIVRIYTSTKPFCSHFLMPPVGLEPTTVG